MQPWLKLAALLLVVAALGLPVNDLFRYALLVIATVLVVAGTVSAQLAPWLAALAAVALCVLGQIIFPAPRIEEGHNVFLIDDAGDSLSVHSRESGNPRLRVPGERSETRDPETRSAAPGSPLTRGRTDGGGALEAGLPRAGVRLIAVGVGTVYPPLRRERQSRLLARASLSGPNLRLFRRRHLRPRGLFAPRDGNRLLRSGGASPRLHSPARLQLEFTRERRHPRAPRPQLAGVPASVDAGDAVVRALPLPRRLRRQRAVLAGRSAVGTRGRDVRHDHPRRHAMPHAHARRRRARHFRRGDRAWARHATRADVGGAAAPAGRARPRAGRQLRGAGVAGARPG